MDFDTAVMLSVIGLFAAFWLAERLIGGGRSFPPIRFWTLIGLAGFAVTFVLSGVLPAVIAPAITWIHLFDLASWGLWAVLPTVMLTTFLTYWSHRIQHRFDILWRAGHQLHHSVMRVDIASGMIFHPVDAFVQVTMASLAAALLGVTAQAAGIAGVTGFAIGLYQHFNVATPAWVGWFIQTPEQHLRHHERDVHARNFGDMPLWDRLFGTYAAPAEGPVEVGFAPERSRRWLAMILFVDVNAAQNRAKI
ncbi:MAG: sterol desaturase family protein [Alphaproteobacteria bacterium]|nr:sterol desaturase family protein [Alphaproteobacteria bacterium]